MKKILFAIFAAAAMSAACTQFEEDTVPSYDSAAKPEVTATVVSDTEVTVTVTAGAGTNFWGYAVMTGAPGATADKLVANGYAKAANVVVQGEEKTPQAAQVKYSEETKTVTLNLTGLTPYTDYTVYAAAVSKMGVVSEVAEITVKTTDGTQPVLTAVDFEEADEVLTFAISFNDPVSLTGNGTAKAWFYAENYFDKATGALIVYKEVDIPADHIVASGKNLIVAVPEDEYIPGAYVAITYSADIVKNGAGAVNVAYDTHIIAYDAKGAIQKKGIFGYYDYANWDFSLVDPSTLPDEPEDEEIEGEGDEEEEEEKVPVYFSNWTELVMPNYVVSDYPLAGKTGEGGVEIKTSEASGKTVSYPAKTFGVLTDFIAGVKLNEQPSYGSTVSYTIAEGTFVDIFGNVNNEFTAEDEYFHSYGYTLDDIVGSYVYTAESAYGYGPQEGTWTIVASDKPEKGNVMFTEMYSTTCIQNVYATFDMVSGTLKVPSLQLYGANDNYMFAFCSSDNEGQVSDVDVYFSVPQPGVINGQSGYFGDAAVDLATYKILGFFDVYYGFEAVRAQGAAKTPARASVRGQF